jgi:hypothetical protein
MGAWMRANLTSQGYCLTNDQHRQLAIALRFSTALCLPLVIVALALHATAMVFALSAIGLIAGLRAHHPFDHLWNNAARHLFAAPKLPPNPRHRRDAFKVGTVWLALVGALLAVGATTAALVLGALLVAACASVTATNLCLPSEMFAWLERRRAAANRDQYLKEEPYVRRGA